ncbi:MAG: GGDEF domain-containing protein [Candidatus Nomurabacteria bacterium]|nr:MAG: GGDEF domain-containing protein [Candidatus Nomurabacteria bacterium]
MYVIYGIVQTDLNIQGEDLMNQSGCSRKISHGDPSKRVYKFAQKCDLNKEEVDYLYTQRLLYMKELYGDLVKPKCPLLNRQIWDDILKELQIIHLKKQLEQALRIDPLTEMSNRKFFDEQMLEFAQHLHSNGSPTSLVLVDIDNFKTINDTLGHPFGDLVIKAVVKCITSNIRDHDVAARYGGEEFAVIVDGDREAASKIAERIRQDVSKIDTSRLNGSEIKREVTISCGVASFIKTNRSTETVNSVIKRADEALYKAKNTGRNRTVISE